MSDLTGLMAISFFGLGGMYIFFYISRIATDAAAQIVTGTIDGTPIPVPLRRLMLYQQYVCFAAGAVACGFFVALVALRVATQVGDGGINPVAYAVAFLGAGGAIAWTINGTMALFFYRSILRQAAAD